MASSLRSVNPNAESMDKAAALFMNINAAKGLQDVMKTNLGPRGTIKMLVDGAGGIQRIVSFHHHHHHHHHHHSYYRIVCCCCCFFVHHQKRALTAAFEKKRAARFGRVFCVESAREVVLVFCVARREKCSRRRARETISIAFFFLFFSLTFFQNTIDD